MKIFKILQKDKNARLGRLNTPHGEIKTPQFIPVGTQASVKAISPADLEEIGVQIILANTYHLMLRPGAEKIANLGGLHEFMSWKHPIMTDSGGFQVFSLGVGLASGEGKFAENGIGTQNKTVVRKQKLANVSKEGVTFQSHLDGSRHFLGPEESMKIQLLLGGDLVVAFDDHESIHMSREQILESMFLTEKWGLESLAQLKKHKSKQLIYGVVHGAVDADLRKRSATFTDKYFEAIAIGGIYGTKGNLYKIVEWVLENVSGDKPRHLLGIGEVEDLFNGVERGVDFFDCVAPMRRARNGSLYISPKNGGKKGNNFTLNIRLAKYSLDKKPIDSGCACYTCQNFTRAYVNHLYRANEILFHNLTTYHNIYFITNLMGMIRVAIGQKQFRKLKESWIK
jgi:queuine tRNA-ribosyltransferase